MTLWLRNSGGFDYGYVGVKTTGGAVLNEVRHGRNSGSYNRYVVTFNSGGNSQVVLMAGLWGPGSNVWEQLDNVTVVAV